jgi:hypothetical protein
VANDENWFESDEEMLDRNAADDNAALGEKTYEAEETFDSVPITSSADDVTGDRAQLVESDTPGQGAQIKYDNEQEIQIIAPPLGETAVEPTLPDTQLSFATPRLHPITSSTLPTPSPLVHTPVDSTNISQGPSSDIPTSQPQFSHPEITETIDHDDHFIVSSDLYNTGPSGDAELRSIDTQTRGINNQDLEIHSLEVIHDGNSLQSVHEHSSSSKLACIDQFAVLQGNESATFDADEPESTNNDEVDGDDLGFDLTLDGRFGQSDGKSMTAYHSVSEDDAEDDLDASESEGVGDNETSPQIIEVDDRSPDGYRKRSSDAEEAEDDESNIEDRELSDDAEGDENEFISEQSEQSEQSDTGTGYEEESADEDYRETLTSRIPQRIVHPEVIVLDSDSEDEPRVVNAPSSMHRNGASNGIGRLSHHEDENETTSQDIVHVEEDRVTYSDEEEEEEEDEEDEDMMPSEIQAPEYENAGHEHMPTHEVYDLDGTGYAQAEEADEHETPTRDMDEIVFLRGNVESAPRQSDTPKVRLIPSARGDSSSVDNDMMTCEEQEISSLLNFEEMPVEDDDIDVKEEQSPVPEGQPLVQEQFTSSTRILQRLAYRTVSPVPVPTPPSTVNDESQSKYVERTVPVAIDHASSPESEIAEAGVNNSRYRRWIDGSDERPLQDPSLQFTTEEIPVHDLSDGDGDASEKLDEVILVEDHPMRLTETGSHEVNEIVQPDLQVDPTPSIVETTKSRVYATFAMLGEWLDKAVDVIAVAVDVSLAKPSTSKADEYHLKLRVTDISMAGTTVIVDIIQPTEVSLPRVTEGDVVLLSAFQVQTYNGSIELLSSDDSGWVIISPSADQPHVTHSNVTFGERELRYVRLLQSWFREDGAAMTADHMLQLSISQEEKQPSPFSAASSDAGSLESTRSGPVSRPRPRRKRGHRRVTIHELRDGRRYTEFGWLDSDSIHELRDGTVYAHSFDRDR